MKVESSLPPVTKKCWGLLALRLRWGLTARGWLGLGLLSVFLFWAAVHRIQPFLAPTQRTAASILVVEGWIPEYAHRVAVKEFQAGAYATIYVTGGPVVGTGGYINDFQTSASVGAELLVKNGLSQSNVVMTPSHVSGRDRTYSSAVALRDWWREHGIEVKSFNVLTEDVHARRTRLLFQKAFGRDTKVGVIAVANPDYEPAHWWRYSEGVRQILAESIAYIYAKLIFRPD